MKILRGVSPWFGSQKWWIRIFVSVSFFTPLFRFSLTHLILSIAENRNFLKKNGRFRWVRFFSLKLLFTRRHWNKSIFPSIFGNLVNDSRLPEEAEEKDLKTVEKVIYKCHKWCFFFDFSVSVSFSLLNPSGSRNTKWPRKFLHQNISLCDANIKGMLKKNIGNGNVCCRIFFPQKNRVKFLHIGLNWKHSTCTKTFHWKIIGSTPWVRIPIER